MKKDIISHFSELLAFDLRKKSNFVDEENNTKIHETINDLWDSIPEQALGLAAPQIGILERIFVANLSCGQFAFVNPQVNFVSYGQYPSKEACLSLPGFTRTVSRCPEILISADKIINKKDASCSQSMNLKMEDAFIAQHEFDHLEGILISDLPEYQFISEKTKKDIEDREQRIKSQRTKKKINSQNTNKNVSKNKKQRYKDKKRETKILEIQERYLMHNQDFPNISK